MTLVVRYAFRKVPFMIGDVLLTDKQPVDGTGKRLPTVTEAEINELTKAGSYHVVDLAQKIVLVGPNLVMGWSGDDARTASTLFEDLINRNRLYPFSWDELKEYLTHHETLNSSSPVLDVVGILDDGSKLIPFESDNVTPYDTKYFERVTILGTGTDAAAQAIDEADGIPDNVPGLNDSQIGLTVAIQLCGNLLCKEVATRESLRAKFGAGYEIATWYGDRFDKVPDVTFLVWWVDMQTIENPRVLQTPVLVCRYAYHNDVLTVASVRLRRDESAYESCRLAIPPVYRRPTIEEYKSIPATGFVSDSLCSVYLISPVPGETHSLCDLQFGNADKCIKIDETGGKVHLGVNSAYWDRALIEIRRKFESAI